MPPKSGSKTRAYLLWGPEEIRKREALQKLIEELVPAEDRDLDVQYIDASNSGVTGDSILNAARDRAMFSERRVVVVLNAGRLRGSKHIRTQELLAQGLPKLPEFSTLIFMAYADDSGERRGRAPFNEKLMAALKSHGTVKQFAALKPEEMAQLAAAEASLLGKRIAPAAAAQLAARVGTDSQRLVHEVRKLAAYIGDRPAIGVDEVAEMVPPPPDDNIFHLLESTMKGERRQALDLLRQLRESGTVVPVILTMFARTLRQVAQAKFLQDHRVAPDANPESISPDLLNALPEDGRMFKGNQSDWLRKRLWEQARRISWPQLQRALDRLAVTEAGTKGWEQGIEDPELAAEVFIASLCDAVQAPSGGAYGRR
ncbi:MAG: DNA polymerase III subunit delta [Actinomycetota bacterium]